MISRCHGAGRGGADGGRSFFLKGEGEGRCRFLPAENPFAIIYRRVGRVILQRWEVENGR